ncbi:unnamed protein product [Arctogadus glacialis]
METHLVARTVKKWKFFADLSFLDPFVTPRETSSNLPRVAEDEVEDDGLQRLHCHGQEKHLRSVMRQQQQQGHRTIQGRGGREPGGYRVGTPRYKRPSSRPCIGMQQLPQHPSSQRTHSSSTAYFLPWRDCHAK